VRPLLFLDWDHRIPDRVAAELAKRLMQNPDSSMFRLKTNNVLDKVARWRWFELPALAGNLPRPHRFRWPVVLLAGCTNIAHSQSTIQDQRSERSGASQMERMLATTELVGESDVALVPRSDEDPELTTGW